MTSYKQISKPLIPHSWKCSFLCLKMCGCYLFIPCFATILFLLSTWSSQPYCLCKYNSGFLLSDTFENLSSTFLISVQCIKYYSRWCFLMMCFYMKPHFVLYAALSKNQTCNYANMYAFIMISFIVNGWCTSIWSCSAVLSAV